MAATVVPSASIYIISVPLNQGHWRASLSPNSRFRGRESERPNNGQVDLGPNKLGHRTGSHLFTHTHGTRQALSFANIVSQSIACLLSLLMPWSFKSEIWELKIKKLTLCFCCLFFGFALHHFYLEVLSLKKEDLKRVETQVEGLEGTVKENTYRVIFQNTYQWQRYYNTVRGNLPKGANTYSQSLFLTVRREIFILLGRSSREKGCLHWSLKNEAQSKEESCVPSRVHGEVKGLLELLWRGRGWEGTVRLRGGPRPTEGSEVPGWGPLGARPT